MVYEDRIIFFFDILGFRAWIGKNPDESEQILKALKTIKEFFDNDLEEKYTKSKQITFFSDSIIISFREDDVNHIFPTLCEVQLLLICLMNEGIIMRGSIGFGKLFHDSNFIFGSAFIEAYDSERLQAQNPRIICDRSILLLNHGTKTSKEFAEDLPYFLDILAIDDDGYLYIDYLNNLESEFEEDIEYLGYLLSVKAFIIEKTEIFKDDKTPGLLEKYLWLKDKYNSTIETYKKDRDEALILDVYFKELYQKLTSV